ncbi:hypothetical protein P8452_39507 [Trifolium repens]|nr:hypothetical protein P8452_34256 [Trifolium repens]WJX53524.1 hypothetical protein P8452_39507 [Trifolium repens]
MSLFLLHKFGETSFVVTECPLQHNSQSLKHSKTRHDLNPAFTPQSESSRSWGWGAYAVPAVVLGFAGIAAFFHYNDERRAVPKGTFKLLF